MIRPGDVVVPFSASGHQKGHWWRWSGVGSTSGLQGVKLSCPECGAYGSLRDPEDWPLRADVTHGHTIDQDGTVTPSVVCPHRCGWHVWVRLARWTP